MDSVWFFSRPSQGLRMWDWLFDLLIGLGSIFWRWLGIFHPYHTDWYIWGWLRLLLWIIFSAFVVCLVYRTLLH